MHPCNRAQCQYSVFPCHTPTWHLVSQGYFLATHTLDVLFPVKHSITTWAVCSFPITALPQLEIFIYPPLQGPRGLLDCLIVLWVRKEWNHFLLEWSWAAAGKPVGGLPRSVLRSHHRGRGWEPFLAPHMNSSGLDKGLFSFWRLQSAKRLPFLSTHVTLLQVLSPFTTWAEGSKLGDFLRTLTLQKPKLDKRCLGVPVETYYCLEWNVLPPSFAS